MTSTTIFGSDLLQHNLVVFRNGEGSLQTLPPLVDVIPEARLNLVIYFLRQDDVNEAYGLIKNLEPTVPQEYILKGVVNAAVGQESSSREHLKIAQQYFQLVSTYLITLLFTQEARFSFITYKNGNPFQYILKLCFRLEGQHQNAIRFPDVNACQPAFSF